MRQRGRFGATHYRALVLAAAALALWWAWPRAAAPLPDTPAAEAAAAADAVGREATAPGPPHSDAPRADATRPVPTAGGASAPAVIEVCGVGQVPAAPGADRPEPLSELPPHLGRHALDAARERTQVRLEQGGVRQRVAARLWRELDVRVAGAAPLDVAGAAALVDEAAAGSDVVAQGAALRLCQALPDVPACERRLVAAALRSDPGNARWHAQWMVLGPDPAQAWQSLLQSQAWRSDFGQMAATVRAALPADLAPYLASQLAIEGLGLDLWHGVDNIAPMLRRCRIDGPPAERAPAAQCDRLARLLVERSDMLLTMMIGRRVAEGAGWPADRLQALQAELVALQGTRPLTEAEAAQPLGCNAGAAMARYLDVLAREGEPAAMRASLSSPPPHGPR